MDINELIQESIVGHNNMIKVNNPTDGLENALEGFTDFMTGIGQKVAKHGSDVGQKFAGKAGTVGQKFAGKAGDVGQEYAGQAGKANLVIRRLTGGTEIKKTPKTGMLNKAYSATRGFIKEHPKLAAGAAIGAGVLGAGLVAKKYLAKRKAAKAAKAAT